MKETRLNLCRIPTRAEYAELKEWVKANPLKRWRNGDTREDGLVFCGYGYGYINGEYWSSIETHKKRLAYCAKRMANLRKDEDYRKVYNEYSKKRYAARPDIRAKSLKRSQKHNDKPEAKERNREYAKQWRRNNQEWFHALVKSRALKKKSQLHPSHDKSKEIAMRKEARYLTKQTGEPWEIDHIIPIACGGWHHHDNLQVISRKENQRKKANPFYASIGCKDFRSIPQFLWPENLADGFLACMTT